MTSYKTSVVERKMATEVIKEIMKHKPFVSLNELEKESGYCKAMISQAYMTVRKSGEWKTWIEKYKCSEEKL